MALINSLRTRLDQRARYLRTLAELNTLSTREAADLGLDRADFARIARECVYGA